MPRKTKRTGSRRNKTHKRQKKMRGGFNLFGTSDSTVQPSCTMWERVTGKCNQPAPVQNATEEASEKPSVFSSSTPAVGGKKKSKKSKK